MGTDAVFTKRIRLSRIGGTDEKGKIVGNDDRIPLRLRPSGPLPAPDPHAMLMLVGTAGQDEVRGSGGWCAVRRLPGLASPAAPRPHPGGCACCVVRSGLALELSELFARRARGEVGLLRRVVLLIPAGDLAHARELLAADPVMRARYRLCGPLG